MRKINTNEKHPCTENLLYCAVHMSFYPKKGKSHENFSNYMTGTLTLTLTPLMESIGTSHGIDTSNGIDTSYGIDTSNEIDTST